MCYLLRSISKSYYTINLYKVTSLIALLKFQCKIIWVYLCPNARYWEPCKCYVRHPD